MSMHVIPKLNGPVAFIPGTCKSAEPVIARDAALPKEGYVLEVEPEKITITAADSAGEFYARQTLEQLAGEGEIPCGRYEDAPKYGFRAYMLDVSRHFFGVEEVKKLLDQMARLKLNIFHWHLSDDIGYRIESKKFPQLNEIGSWRMENGEKIGGFYTQEEIKEVVEYAKARAITIIPEIDLPGHTGDIISTFPELSCSGEPHTIAFLPELNPRILCAGNDKVYEFLYELLGEVCDLFPGPYFHIGGDEAPKPEWKKCPRCQQRIQEEDLKDEEDLQAWFTGKLVEFLEGRGKTVIGWNEILTSGTVSPKAIAQYWVDSDKECSDREADKGRRFVFSPVQSFYLDYPSALVSLRATYSYEPHIMEGKPIPAGQVLGLEAPLWTERVSENGHAERLTFPRLLALAENAWTKEKDYEDFKLRATKYMEYLKAQGIETTPMEESDPSGEEGARMVGSQVVEVMSGFTQAFKDKEQRGKVIRDGSSGMIKRFIQEIGYSEAEMELALEAMEEAVKAMGL